MVLELARHPGSGASAGMHFAAVSSVHGVLAPLSRPASAGEITGRVQAHHAELDFQGDGALSLLEAELKAGVNGTDGLWETLKYATCHHMPLHATCRYMALYVTACGRRSSTPRRSRLSVTSVTRVVHAQVGYTWATL